MAREEVTRAVQKVLREAPAGLKELASDSGLSYDVLRSWRTGRRSPHPESARRLLEGLERGSGRLERLMKELRATLEAEGG